MKISEDMFDAIGVICCTSLVMFVLLEVPYLSLLALIVWFISSLLPRG